MRNIVILFVLVLLLCGCACNENQTTVQIVSQPPATTQAKSPLPTHPMSSPEVSAQPAPPSPSATLPPQRLSSKWHYDLKRVGLYRTDSNTEKSIKINDQWYAAGIIITEEWLFLMTMVAFTGWIMRIGGS